MVLQHNIEALNANGKFKVSTNRQAKSAEKLSSGYKINRAADNAAGLTISEGMRSMIRGLLRASDNAADGLSLLQTADGALEEVHSILHRARELSVQAANDTNTELDRAAIQSEMDNLMLEINRISDTTEFNTLKLLDGSIAGDGSTSSYIGQNMAEGAAVVRHGMQRADDMIIENPVHDSSAVNQVGSTVRLDNVDKALEDIVPRASGAIAAAFPQTFGSDPAISSQIGVRLYSDGSTTLASVGCRYYFDAGGMIDRIELSLSVNVATLRFNGDDLETSSKKELEATIAHEMMHAFMDDVLTNGMVGATNGVVDRKNRFPGWFIEGMAQTAAGGCSNYNDWVNGGLGLNENSSEGTISAVVSSSSHKLSSGSVSSQYGTGYLACMYLGYLASGGNNVSSSAIAGGLDNLLNQVKGGTTLSEAINQVSGGKYKSLFEFQKNFGDADSSHFIKLLLGEAGTGGSGSVIAGGLGSGDVLAGAASDPNKYKPDFNNAFVPSNQNGTDGHTWKDGGSGGYGGGPALKLQVGSRAWQGVAISVDAMHTMALGLDGLSVMSYEEASNALDAIDYAITAVSENRSSIGAYMNRLEHTIANLDNTGENTQAAESRLRDTDMAEEMVEYSATNIMMQAGQAILAQANQGKQGILQLLQ